MKAEKTRLKNLMRKYRNSMITNNVYREENIKGRKLSGQEIGDVLLEVDNSISVIKSGLTDRGSRF